MQTECKELLVKHGSTDNPLSCNVLLNGIMPDEKLTPRLAERAARIACGHRSRVTVIDTKAAYGYRLYKQSARKLTY